MTTRSPFLTTLGHVLRRSVVATAVGATLASGAVLAGELKGPQDHPHDGAGQHPGRKLPPLFFRPSCDKAGVMGT